MLKNYILLNVWYILIKKYFQMISENCHNIASSSGFNSQVQEIISAVMKIQIFCDSFNF